jgi:hypothetical protein
VIVGRRRDRKCKSEFYLAINFHLVSDIWSSAAT